MRFVCAMCGETMVSERDEAGALAELERDFPGFEPEDCGLVCDACYLLICAPEGCA